MPYNRRPSLAGQKSRVVYIVFAISRHEDTHGVILMPLYFLETDKSTDHRLVLEKSIGGLIAGLHTQLCCSPESCPDSRPGLQHFFLSDHLEDMTLFGQKYRSLFPGSPSQLCPRVKICRTPQLTELDKCSRLCQRPVLRTCHSP